MEVPREQHRYVQGSRSVNLHSILESTGVWVDLPPHDSDSNSVTLRGNPAKFGDALNIIFAKVTIRLLLTTACWIFMKIGPNILIIDGLFDRLIALLNKYISSFFVSGQ